MARGISKRHALTDAEGLFVRIYCAFGSKNAAEAYRRSHLVEDGDAWFEKTRKGEPNHDKPIDAKEASRRANRLLDQDYITGFLAELEQPAGDSARTLLGDSVLFTDEKTALGAAGRVLDDEDKLGFRDAVEQWAEIMCAIGTEVVVPLPDGREVVFDMRSMFPTYAEAMPPRDVVEKTINALAAYRDQLDQG